MEALIQLSDGERIDRLSETGLARFRRRHVGRILVLATSGLVIATAGALLPASWAARTGTATALRAE